MKDTSDGAQQHAIAQPELTAVVASAPAGWYVLDEGIRRWFDGRDWTDHYTPVLSSQSSEVVLGSTSHGFHLIMTIMTLGTWVPVWAGTTVVNAVRHARVRTERN